MPKNGVFWRICFVGWILVSILAPLFSIFCLYLFNQYASLQISPFVALLLAIQIIYSVYFSYNVVTYGISMNKTKLKKFNDDDLILFTDVVDAVEMSKMYFLLILFLILILSVAIFSL